MTSISTAQCLPLESEIVDESNNNVAQEHQEGAVLDQNVVEENVLATDAAISETPALSFQSCYDTSATLILQFSCLYTRQKTQKRKVWQDGRLIVRGCGAVLYYADPPTGSGDPPLDQCDLSRLDVDAIKHGHKCVLEMEKFVVTVDGPWVEKKSSFLKNSSCTVSSSMQKVMSRKFQKPSTVVPPNPASKQQEQSVLGKRRRPLQPGELVRKYYPPTATVSTQDQLPSTMPAWNPRIQKQLPPVSHPGQEQRNLYDSQNDVQPIPRNQNFVSNHIRSQGNDEFNLDHEGIVSCHGFRNSMKVNQQENRPNQPYANIAVSLEVQEPQRPSLGHAVIDSQEGSCNVRNHIPVDFVGPKPSWETKDRFNPGGHCILLGADQQPARMNRKPTSTTNFVVNDFNAASFYGEESDNEEASHEEEPEIFHLSVSQTQPCDQIRDFSHSNHYDKTFSSQMPCSQEPYSYAPKKHNVSQEARWSSGIPTLSTEQLLGMFAIGPLSTNNAVASDNCDKDKIVEGTSGRDEFTLPEEYESSDDDE